jgi:hypothetical protein
MVSPSSALPTVPPVTLAVWMLLALGAVSSTVTE